MALASSGDEIGLEHLSPKLTGAGRAGSDDTAEPRGALDDAPGADGATGSGSLREARNAFEARLIAEVLEQQGGSVLRAARVLGLTRAGLYKKLKEFGLR